MARGYPGQFGRSVNAPWVWIGLCALFVLPFARPPLRLLHLDLAVLLAFSVSYAFFGAADLDVSVPSAYPLLGYLLVRMVIAARRPPRAAAAGFSSGRGSCCFAIAFLAAFRIALNVVDGNVIDVGYAERDRRRPAHGRRPALRRVPARQRARRHLRAGRVRGLRAVRGAARRGAGAGTTCPPRTPRRSRSTSAAPPCCG